jgi:hypothetical protein
LRRSAAGGGVFRNSADLTTQSAETNYQLILTKDGGNNVRCPVGMHAEMTRSINSTMLGGPEGREAEKSSVDLDIYIWSSPNIISLTNSTIRAYTSEYLPITQAKKFKISLFPS